MGDGDGGKNVSTEIEDESQIEDLAKVSAFKYIFITVAV